jgi:hypothetical protein
MTSSHVFLTRDLAHKCLSSRSVSGLATSVTGLTLSKEISPAHSDAMRTGMSVALHRPGFCRGLPPLLATPDSGQPRRVRGQ